MHYGAPELLPLDENDATICAFGMTYKLSEIYQKPQRRDGLLGRPLQRVALYILLQVSCCFYEAIRRLQDNMHISGVNYG